MFQRKFVHAFAAIFEATKTESVEYLTAISAISKQRKKTVYVHAKKRKQQAHVKNSLNSPLLSSVLINSICSPLFRMQKTK